MFNIARARGWLKNPQGGPMNPAAGPSNHAVSRPPQQLTTPQNQNRMKRSSTSPGGEVRSYVELRVILLTYGLPR